MGVADDLLILAERLAQPSSEAPEQVCFRRSVSTAYYALYHLLVDGAVAKWNGSVAVQLGLQRAFQHKNMKEISASIAKVRWQGWSGSEHLVPTALRNVARTFVLLQKRPSSSRLRQLQNLDPDRGARQSRRLPQGFSRLAANPDRSRSQRVFTGTACRQKASIVRSTKENKCILSQVLREIQGERRLRRC